MGEATLGWCFVTMVPFNGAIRPLNLLVGRGAPQDIHNPGGKRFTKVAKGKGGPTATGDPVKRQHKGKS